MGLVARSGIEGGGRTTIQYWGKAVPPIRHQRVERVRFAKIRCLGVGWHMTDQTILATKTCIPCKGGVPRLDRRQAEDLIDGVEAWELNDDATRISRTFEFPNFIEAQAFATRTADLAESQFHHPEITFGWGYCRVEFQTRKIRGLHENDFIMAAKVNELNKGAAVGDGLRRK